MKDIYILSIDTATEVCSVALSCNGRNILCKEQNGTNMHSQILLPYIDEVLHRSGVAKTQLSAIAVSEGPGSYTGLRIGVSTAKGFCYALQIPLIAVPTLMSIANGARQEYAQYACFCPMIDARRMEVYCALYDHDLQETAPADNVIVQENSFAAVLAEHVVVFCGNAVNKVQTVLQHPQAVFATVNCSAKYMADIAFSYYQAQKFADAAYFEPFYLKKFQSAVSKVKGLR
ncbi:MAG: tRNA (adenosine(37)-N6)-threonylcarbamoyltransferase complex dimerization subunit type 1 TsaB [Bacteroidales bacterium]|nr:tRNA (adenosine(37)-N6)-threonylcarbamoyltransferase complex dimerization subunit type 1 TsaB [Bacteroidales bacterium]